MTIWLQPVLVEPDEYWQAIRNDQHVGLNQSINVGHSVRGFDFVLEITKLKSGKSFELCYANALSEREATYVTWAVYENNQWVIVIPEQNEFEQVFRFSFSSNQLLRGFFHEQIYSERTLYIIDEFPLWTTMRQNKSSLGHQLINSVALSAEQFRNDLTTMLNNFSVQTIQKNDQPWVSIFELPDVLTNTMIFKKTNQSIIPIHQDLHLFYNNLYAGVVIDYAEKKAYTREILDTIVLESGNQTYTLHGSPHLIWSQLDEWGILIGLNRMSLETNRAFARRIETYFLRASSATKSGLLEAIARDTNQVQRAIWKDDNEHFVIPHRDVIRSTIQVDHEYVKPSDFLDHEITILKAKETDQSHHVSWIRTFTLHDGTSDDPAWIQKAKDAFGLPNVWWESVLLQLASQFRHVWQYGYWNQTYFDQFDDESDWTELPLEYDVKWF